MWSVQQRSTSTIWPISSSRACSTDKDLQVPYGLALVAGSVQRRSTSTIWHSTSSRACSTDKDLQAPYGLSLVAGAVQQKDLHTPYGLAGSVQQTRIYTPYGLAGSVQQTRIYKQPNSLMEFRVYSTTPKQEITAKDNDKIKPSHWRNPLFSSPTVNNTNLWYLMQEFHLQFRFWSQSTEIQRSTAWKHTAVSIDTEQIDARPLMPTHVCSSLLSSDCGESVPHPLVTATSTSQTFTSDRYIH